jgi:hypothetical protein
MLASSAARSQVWKRLWNLHVPRKIKVFGWQVLHGFIPCRAAAEQVPALLMHEPKKNTFQDAYR